MRDDIMNPNDFVVKDTDEKDTKEIEESSESRNTPTRLYLKDDCVDEFINLIDSLYNKYLPISDCNL